MSSDYTCSPSSSRSFLRKDDDRVSSPLPTSVFDARTRLHSLLRYLTAGKLISVENYTNLLDKVNQTVLGTVVARYRGVTLH